MRRLLIALALLTSCAFAQQPATRNWKDKAEYELANAALAETDPARKLAYLDTWTANYPETDYIDARQSLYEAVRRQLNQPAEALSTAPEPPLLKVEAQYTDEARLAGLEGSVWVTGTVAGDGSLQNPRVDRPLGLGLDEQAIAAAAQLRFESGRQQPRTVTVPIDFALPSKQSRWHLVAAAFKPPAGASRPTFAAADYPLGSGLSLAAYDEARLLGAIGRAASATVSFDIDERGTPGHFQVEKASADVWGPEAVMVIQSWRFHPGMKAGAPVAVPCTLSLVWGPEDCTSHAIAGQVAQMYPPAPVQPPPAEKLAESAIVNKTEPAYTEEARGAGIEGTVLLQLIVNQDGVPESVKVLPSGSALGMGLEDSALNTVQQWRFQPARLNDRPTPMHLTVLVRFRLSGVESSVLLTPPMAVAAAPKPKK